MWLDVLVGIACLVGIVGTIIPILPGAIVNAIAITVWAVFTGGSAWAFTVVALLIIGLATVAKYLLPGRALKRSGVPAWVIFVGGVAGIAGFFLIPVVGVIIGFLVGIYLAELARLRSFSEAWPTSLAAMKAVGLSTLIDLTSAMLATLVWLTGVFVLS